MRTALLITVAAAAIAGAALVLLLTQTDWLDFRAAPPPTESPERALLLAGVETVGFGTERSGTTVRADGAGAVFAMQGGREIAVTPPDGWRVGPEFALFTPITAGFFLMPEAEGPAEYVTFFDFRTPIEPTNSAEGMQAYGEAAEKIRAAGQLPFLGQEVTVLRAVHGATEVVLCLETSDGTRLQGGIRYVGALWVSPFRVGGCPEDEVEIRARLDRAEAALSTNR